MKKKLSGIIFTAAIFCGMFLTSNVVSAATLQDRLCGNNRYETNSKIVDSGWTSSEYVVIASGEGFADALCAAPLAEKNKAPILLTGRDALSSEAKEQLTRLKVKRVFIVGGTASVSDNVKSEITNMNIETTRIYGQNRFETSLAVAKALGNINGVVVTNGFGFADALSIAPIAAKKGMPILLTDKDDLSTPIKEFLHNSSYNESYIVGGTGVISDKVSSQLNNVTRLGGNSRYDTNSAILNHFANDFSYDKVYIASGENYPDALSGSVLAASSSSPLILVGSYVDPSVESSIKAQHEKYNNVVALGGTGVVTDSVINSIVSGVFIPGISDDEIKNLIYNADQAYIQIHSLGSYDENDSIPTEREGETYYKLKDNVNTYDKLFNYYNKYFSEKKSNYFINTDLFIKSNNIFYILGCNPGTRPLFLQSKIENKTVDNNKINVTLNCYHEDDNTEEESPSDCTFTLIYENGCWLVDDATSGMDWNDFKYRDNQN
ncbi:cell wall-binding repeat-containing protein [Clostridium autoethanogenum]|uniref:Cell wall-binding repeat-containing protein n=2 Tax=Clostridium autoethanogenum TaxID=84023 RepID=A0A3M0SZA0_9CLOT|nr:cell wall-binding repeat-containing protein [Clostridium autoethanogenum]AGY78181.1 cell wall-binding repeat-containing protein [Clostridium autoethanogenum DSM 10061]ALU38314.1 Cell wall binding repeat 2-containing protein [Clostridium autoethanogenum DSM 10061]OVY51077.1 N-acetylmuramoyl-L-alanine amidase LytC precursor [Clostridium autoethanogenum]RMD03255.1 cell wall-binding repeat-containing protein [Clostridium autoethanogenum]